jgi:hypothetical protein
MTLIMLAGNFWFDQDILFKWAATDPDQQRIPLATDAEKTSTPIYVAEKANDDNKETEN